MAAESNPVLTLAPLAHPHPNPSPNEGEGLFTMTVVETRAKISEIVMKEPFPLDGGRAGLGVR